MEAQEYDTVLTFELRKEIFHCVIQLDTVEAEIHQVQFCLPYPSYNFIPEGCKVFFSEDIGVQMGNQKSTNTAQFQLFLEFRGLLLL